MSSICRVCSKEKDIEFFKKGTTICKDCHNFQSRERYKINQTKLIQQISEAGIGQTLVKCSGCKISKTSDNYNKTFRYCSECQTEKNKNLPKRKSFTELNIKEKKCCSCNAIKNISMFFAKSTYCKDCTKKRTQDYYQKNKQKIIETNKIYRKTREEKNIFPNIEGSKVCKTCSVEKNINEFSLKSGNFYELSCNNCRSQQNKLYKKQNPQSYKDWYNKNKTYLLLRSRLKKAFKTGKSAFVKKFLNIDFSLFEEFISFCCDKLNYDINGKDWHFDHIIPCKYFKEDEKHICFHWTNIIPLKANLNLSKSAKILQEQIEFSRNLHKEFCFKTNLVFETETIFYSKYDSIIQANKTKIVGVN